MKLKSVWMTGCLTLLFAQTAFAHTLGAQGASFYHGFIHPLSGLDHLLAMLAVGVWAAQIGGRARWLIPVAFIAMLAVGGGLGRLEWILPQVELGIAASVFVFGLLIVGATRLPISVSVGMAGLFALFHGYAHGVEMPQAAAPGLYALGFIASSAMLHGLGVVMGMAGHYHWPSRLLRLGGMCMAMAGVWLLTAL